MQGLTSGVLSAIIILLLTLIPLSSTVDARALPDTTLAQTLLKDEVVSVSKLDESTGNSQAERKSERKIVRTADGRDARAGRLIVAWENKATLTKAVEQASRVRSASADAKATILTPLSATTTLVVADESLDIDALRAQYQKMPGVRSAEPDYVVRTSDSTNDAYTSFQWALTKLSMTSAWSTTTGSPTKIVAVLDTGIYDDASPRLAPDGRAGHPDLRGKVAGRIDLIGSASGTDDVKGHGTHIAGIISAIPNNALGVAGIGHQTRVLNVKVLDDTGSGFASDIAAGIRWSVDNGATVVNLSLGGEGPCPVYIQDAINYAWSRNVVAVAAAGNSASSTPQFPANCTNTLSVANSNQTDELGALSNYGTWITVVAPGTSIVSTGRDGDYRYGTGTSMAAPHVSALAALLQTTAWGSSASSVVERIKSSADKIAGTGSQSANGRVNASKAVAPLVPVATPTPLPTPLPTSTPPRVAPAACALNTTPATTTVYLPNVTKNLGGNQGWSTPFIVQNIGSIATDLELVFYRFEEGVCALRLTRSALAAGTSASYDPRLLIDLPTDGQYSVVIRSTGSEVVAIVNGHKLAAAPSQQEAMSYVGFSGGSTTVSLPNVLRRFGGWVTPFIIQNLGSLATTASIRFTSFNGLSSFTTVRSIEPGRAQFVDPNSQAGLLDDTQYSVTISASQPLAVVVNSHNDAPGTPNPVAMSSNGVSVGSPTLYGAYAAKNTPGTGRYSTVIVQNTGSTPVIPRLAFTPLSEGSTGAAPVHYFTRSNALAPGASWAFDVRRGDGGLGALCGSTATPGCLGDGEYSFIVTATPLETGAQVALATVVNVHTAATAMSYTARGSVTPGISLPNVTRTFGGSSGWNTPLYVQSIATGSSTISIEWRRFSDGALLLTQNLSLAGNNGLRIDPSTVAGLTDNTQYALTIRSSNGSLSAIVMQLASGGDNAMIYEGFATLR